MHKEFKCIDVSSDRIYISHDAIFDESVFLLLHYIPMWGHDI
jgi:hypothetical protein